MSIIDNIKSFLTTKTPSFLITETPPWNDYSKLNDSNNYLEQYESWTYRAIKTKAEKVNLSFENGLKPIFCCGEALEISVPSFCRRIGCCSLSGTISISFHVLPYSSVTCLGLYPCFLRTLATVFS